MPAPAPDSPDREPSPEAAITLLGSLDTIQTLLDALCGVTQMRFAAVTCLPDERWIPCAVRDDLALGLQPGDPWPAEGMLCYEVRRLGVALAVDELGQDPRFRTHAMASQHGVQSYLGVPIHRRDGDFFGTLCAMDGRPRSVNRAELLALCRVFAETIADALEAAEAAARLETVRRQLRESEERHRLALDGADLGSWDVDLRTGVAMWNRRHAESQGYHFGEGPASLDLWTDRVHPDDRARVFAEIDRARATRQPLSIEHRIRRADTGETRWLALYGRFFYDAAGEAVRFCGISRDVSASYRAERELQTSQRRLALARAAAGLGVYDYEIESGKIEWDALLRGWWGASADEQITIDTFWAGVHPDDRPSVRAEIERSLELGRGEDFRSHYRVIHRHTGATRWLAATGRVIFADARAERIVGAVQDVSEQRETELALRASEERYRATFENAAVGISHIGLDGRWLRFNDAAGAITGYPRERLQELTVADITPPDDIEPYRENTRRVLSGEIATFTMPKRYLRPDGSIVWVRLTVSLLRDRRGDPLHFISIIEDITESRRLEAAILRAREEAEAANRAKDRFIATLSHELRTPLTPVLLGLCSLEADERYSPELRETFRTMRRNIDLEALLIDDLLDVTRIAEGKLKLERLPSDLHKLLADTAEIAGHDREDGGARLVMELHAIHSHALADPARMYQVFWNLLNNAFKFTPPGGTVTVRSENDASGRIVIQVEDTGVGISDEALPRIFRAFEQGDSHPEQRQAGLGLGLAITDAIVRLHGGSIVAESRGVGLGSIFTLVLDTLSSPVPPVESMPVGAVELRPLRLLLLEDHEPTREILGHLFRSRGHQTHLAGTVREALALAETHECDLVISDLHLPDGTGCEFLLALRQRRAWPAIALSGFGMPADVQKAIDAGFGKHLTKPVDFEVLTAACEALLRAGAQ